MPTGNIKTPHPAELDSHLTPSDWGTPASGFVTPDYFPPTLDSLSWTDKLFALSEAAAEHAKMILDDETPKRKWFQEAFTATENYLTYTQDAFTYGAAFWAVVYHLKVQEVKNWQRQTSGFNTSLDETKLYEVGGLARAAAHMVMTNIFLAATRLEASNRG